MQQALNERIGVRTDALSEADSKPIPPLEEPTPALDSRSSR
jgi:hypothetical protein